MLTMVKEQKKRKQLLKGLAKARLVGASYHNQDVNKWKEPVMKVCLDEYYEELAAKYNIVELVNHAAIAKKYGISPLTLHHCVSKLKSSHQVRGWRHASSGKRQPQKFTVGKCTSSFLSTALSHEIGLTGMTFKLSNQLHVFSSDEDDMAKAIIAFQNAGFPLTVPRLHSLAYQYAKINNIKGFNDKDEIGGGPGLSAFLMRYPHIKVRKAKNLYVVHAMVANKINIQNWFKEYREVIYKLHITSPEQIWSGDKTRMQNIPKEDKFLGEVKKPLYNQVPADQGETSTVLMFVSAVGRVCPPMVIPEDQRVQRDWATNMPITCKLAVTSKGYITKAKIHEYGVHFVKYLDLFSLLGQPNLLILDSHKLHIYNVAFYDEMKEHDIHLLAIPPHTSHLVQALDSTPFAEFKHCWQKNLLNWLFNNKGLVLSKKSFSEVFWPSFQESMTVAKIQSGFRKTGVFPINMNAIDKAKFAPAQVTDSKDHWMFVKMLTIVCHCICLLKFCFFAVASEITI